MLVSRQRAKEIRRERRRAGLSSIHLWTPGGVAWLAVSVVALAAGLFPELIVPSQAAAGAMPLAVMRTLAVGEVGFLWLIYPLILARRPAIGGRRRAVVDAFGEAVLWMIVAAPLWATAAYLSDGTLQDALRSVLSVLAAFPVAWALAALFRRGASGVSVATLVAVLAVFGGVAGDYLVVMFGPAAPEWIESAFPVTFAWSAAAQRQVSWTPQPLWAWVMWPAAGFVVLVCCVLWPSRKGREYVLRAL